ncbi:MAG: cupin domain-containing protein [Methylovulum sp.]|nr:cupin domain-containing protein [Methylovulum sp.]
MNRKSIFKISVLVLMPLAMLFCGAVQTVSAQEKPAFNRMLLLENALQLPGDKLNARVIRVIFPPAFKTPDHTHEGPGPRYVVKGRLKVVEGGKTDIYKAGDVFWESGQLMSVENLDEESAEMIIFELAPVKPAE